MVVTTWTAMLCGLEAELIKIETDISPGLPTLELVGLPTREARAARNRIRAALRYAGYRMPNRRMTVNLSSSKSRLHGNHFDLAIAIGLLAASGQIPVTPMLSNIIWFAELSLDGSLKAGPGVISVLTSVENPRPGNLTRMPSRFVFAEPSWGQVSMRAEWQEQSLCCRHLTQAIDWYTGKINSDQVRADTIKKRKNPAIDIVDSRSYVYDFGHVRGQYSAKRALEIAAAGGHHILLAGPAGAGKTLLARCLPSILPKLGEAERIEVTAIYHAARLLADDACWGRERPFRAPQPHLSKQQLFGGRRNVQIGELTLAHAGVLFFDELPSFDRPVLESLRIPLEQGILPLWQEGRPVNLPADFQFVATMNLCPCARLGLPEDAASCVCTPYQIARHRQRISHAFADRIDIYVQVTPYSIIEQQNDNGPPKENSKNIRKRVVAAYYRQKERGMRNGRLRGAQLRAVSPLRTDVEKLFNEAAAKMNLSGRAFEGVWRVARTIADLDAADDIQSHHLAEALLYRSLA